MAWHISNTWLIVAASGSFLCSLQKVLHVGSTSILPPAVLGVGDDPADLSSRPAGRLLSVGSFQPINRRFSRVPTVYLKKTHLENSLGLGSRCWEWEFRLKTITLLASSSVQFSLLEMNHFTWWLNIWFVRKYEWHKNTYTYHVSHSEQKQNFRAERRVTRHITQIKTLSVKILLISSCVALRKKLISVDQRLMTRKLLT